MPFYPFSLFHQISFIKTAFWKKKNSCAGHVQVFNLLYFTQGLKQKAEALYTKGNFEFALVFYQRGFKLRPEVKEFRLGIQKAQEAIDNSIGGKVPKYDRNKN